MYYSEDSNYGIFACELVEENEDSKKVIFNNYGNFTVKGIMPILDEQKTYMAKLKEVKDKKYGVGYEIVSIYEEAPTTRAGQEEFLRLLITDRQVDEILAVYPNENIIELIETEKFDFTLVKGIGESTYLKIKEKILENKHMQKALIILQGEYGLTHKTIRKLVEHYCSPQILLEKVIQNPYVLADEVEGIGFIKADEIAQKQGIKKTDYFRQYACLKYVLNKNAEQGHVYMKKDALIKELRELLDIKSQYINTFFDNFEKDDSVEDVGIFNEKYALIKHWRNEKNIAMDVQRLLNHSYPVEIPKLNERIAEIELEQGFEFTDEQLQAIMTPLISNLVLINGKAGTGKTSVIKGIVNILKSTKESFVYETVALSGKASQRIKESTGLSSSTIHRFLGVHPENLNRFIHNRYNPVSVDLLIIDEASMINAYLFAKILEALENGTKVIICGDYSQLEPIGAGNVFFDLCKSKEMTRVELTKVHRQAQKSGILSVANEIREGISPFEKDNFSNRDFGELQDLHLYPYQKGEAVLSRTLSIARQYQKTGKDIMKFQVIVPMKKRGILCTAELNAKLQEIFNPSFPEQVITKRGKVEFREKDKVIHNGNNYNIGVLNGTIGIIEKILVAEKVMYINFDTVGVVEFNFDSLKDIDLSYALTVHRTQGSQFENCVIALDFSSFIMLSRQLIYTAITRSINHCYLICDLDALLKAIKTDKSSYRNTFLPQLLLELH